MSILDTIRNPLGVITGRKSYSENDLGKLGFIKEPDGYWLHTTKADKMEKHEADEYATALEKSDPLKYSLSKKELDKAQDEVERQREEKRRREQEAKEKKREELKKNEELLIGGVTLPILQPPSPTPTPTPTPIITGPAKTRSNKVTPGPAPTPISTPVPPGPSIGDYALGAVKELGGNVSGVMGEMGKTADDLLKIDVKGAIDKTKDTVSKTQKRPDQSIAVPLPRPNQDTNTRIQSSSINSPGGLVYNPIIGPPVVNSPNYSESPNNDYLYSSIFDLPENTQSTAATIGAIKPEPEKSGSGYDYEENEILIGPRLLTPEETPSYYEYTQVQIPSPPGTEEYAERSPQSDIDRGSEQGKLLLGFVPGIGTAMQVGDTVKNWENSTPIQRGTGIGLSAVSVVGDLTVLLPAVKAGVVALKGGNVVKAVTAATSNGSEAATLTNAAKAALKKSPNVSVVADSNLRHLDNIRTLANNIDPKIPMQVIVEPSKFSGSSAGEILDIIKSAGHKSDVIIEITKTPTPEQVKAMVEGLKEAGINKVKVKGYTIPESITEAIKPGSTIADKNRSIKKATEEAISKEDYRLLTTEGRRLSPDEAQVIREQIRDEFRLNPPPTDTSSIPSSGVTVKEFLDEIVSKELKNNGIKIKGKPENVNLLDPKLEGAEEVRAIRLEPEQSKGVDYTRDPHMYGDPDGGTTIVKINPDDLSIKTVKQEGGGFSGGSSGSTTPYVPLYGEGTRGNGGLDDGGADAVGTPIEIAPSTRQIQSPSESPSPGTQPSIVTNPSDVPTTPESPSTSNPETEPWKWYTPSDPTIDDTPPAPSEDVPPPSDDTPPAPYLPPNPIIDPPGSDEDDPGDEELTPAVTPPSPGTVVNPGTTYIGIGGFCPPGYHAVNGVCVPDSQNDKDKEKEKVNLGDEVGDPPAEEPDPPPFKNPDPYDNLGDETVTPPKSETKPQENTPTPTRTTTTTKTGPRFLLNNDDTILVENQRVPRKGTVAWKQGKLWVVVYPPYTEENVIWTDEIPPGAKKVSGPGSAVKTIYKWGGEVTPEFKVMIGAFEATVSRNAKDIDFERVRRL